MTQLRLAPGREGYETAFYKRISVKLSVILEGEPKLYLYSL